LREKAPGTDVAQGPVVPAIARALPPGYVPGRRGRHAPIPLPPVLPSDPRVRDLVVLPRALDAYDPNDASEVSS
jgi:hypothetical protein